MSNLRVIPSTVDDQWVRKLADLLDGDQWVLADTLLEHYSLDEFPSTGDANTGLYEAMRQDELALARGFGIIATVNHLRAVRATAIAWPREDRSSRALFAVHFKMRGVDRQAEMKKRLRQAEREGMALSRRILQRLRADESPRPLRQYDERMRRAIASAVRREMLGGIIAKRDDWWMAEAVTDEARDVAVKALRDLASKIAKGAIPS